MKIIENFSAKWAHASMICLVPGVSFEFSLNVCTEFGNKKNVKLNGLPYLKMLFCKEHRYYRCDRKTQVTEENFKLTLIDASVIYSIP